jgi:hypothetical protein
LALADSLTDLADAQVDLILDSTNKGILFGIVGESATQRWWSSFTGRFGEVEWRSKTGDEFPTERDRGWR